MRDWHRLCGVAFADLVTPYPIAVTVEVELAQIRQRLDTAMVFIADDQLNPHDWPDLPDGLTDLADHNLVTYKSMRQSLTRPAVYEAVSHAVAYCKQQWRRQWASRIDDPKQLRLIAVTTRRPVWLCPGKSAGQRQLMDGVYEIGLLDLAVRIVVPKEVSLVPRNALWHLLSGDRDRVRYGLEHYRVRDTRLYNVFSELRDHFKLEGVEMSYTKEDYIRETFQETLQQMSPREWRDILEGLSSRERRDILEGLSSRERLEGLSRDEIQRYLDDLRNENGNGNTAGSGNS